MGLVNIPNQPLRFMPYDEVRACQNSDQYCYKHIGTDPLSAQWRQVPSGSELACDPFFSNQGPELVTNGGFASDTGWTHDPDWTLGGGQACYADIGGSSLLTQSLAVTPARAYRIIFTLQGYVANTLNLTFTGTFVSGYTADGTYTVDVIAGAINSNIVFSSPDLFEGCITGVSVVELSSCWDFDNANITFGGPPDGGICHIVGAATVATLSTPPLTAPNYYRVQVVISGRSDGSVTVTLGVSGVTSEAVLTTNGINVVYLYADTTGDVTITMSSDFNGCIASVSIFELVSDFALVIKDADGNTVTSDIQTYIDYDGDFVTLATSGFGAIDAGGVGNLPFGCYTLEITDPTTATPYQSNCISYQEEHPNTNLLVGYIVSEGTEDPQYGFGFKFDPFKLVQRLEFYFKNPTYPAVFENRNYSTGYIYKSYATSEKVFEVVFSSVGEIEHDAIRIQLLCPEFYMEKDGGTIVYLNNRSEEYAPDWDKKSGYKFAESRVLIQQRTDVLKLSNL